MEEMFKNNNHHQNTVRLGHQAPQASLAIQHYDDLSVLGDNNLSMMDSTLLCQFVMGGEGEIGASPGGA